MSTPKRMPPVPAPYLMGLEQMPSGVATALSKDRPSSANVLEARRVVRRLRLIIRAARERWERQQGVAIVPEPPPVE